MSRPTVAHLLPGYNPFPPVYPAGTELRVEEVARRQRRYRPLVVCGAFPGQPASECCGTMEIRRVHVGRLYRRLFQKLTRLDPWPYTTRMWRITRREDARVLHIHNEPKLLSGLARRIARAPLPVVVHIANQKPIPRAHLPMVTRWVACSEFMADWLTSQYGVSRDRVQVIHTGVDTARRPPWWSLEAGRRRQLRQRWGVEDEKAVVLLFAGRMVREKGVLETLDAFRRLRAHSSRPLRLLLAGNIRESRDPRDEKALYGAAVRARLEEEDGVRWVGSLAPAQMHDFLVAGDVFLLPSRWDDPFPTVMLEAAAAGLPILGSERGGIVEFLRGCPSVSLLDRPDDPDTWLAPLRRLVEDENLRRAAGRWLRAKVDLGFDWERVTADFENLYDALLDDSPVPSSPVSPRG